MKDVVLVYSRPKLRHWWWQIATAAFAGDNCKLVGLSEFKGHGDICIMEGLYRYWNEPIKPLDNSLFNIDEVRLRCRLLANLPKEQSIKMVTCAWYALNDILEKTKPKYVLSITVDSYVVDLLARACRKCGVKFIGLSSCPLPGYSIISERGESNHFRDPSKEEVTQVYRTLVSDNFKPNTLFVGGKYSAILQIKRSLYCFIKKIVFWFLLKKDPLNYNLMVFPYFSDRKNVFGYRVVKYFTKNALEKWSSSGLPKLYIPLHYIPEATVSYWTKNIDFIDYESTLYNILSKMSDKFAIAIKEHPAAIGTRPDGFYHQLLQFKNTFLVDASLSSLDFVSKSDVVLTWSGTVGLEAVLRSKKVILMGDPYYYLDKYFYKTKSIDDLGYSNFDVKESITQKDCDVIIEYVLGGAIRGVFGYKGYLSKNNAILLGNEIRKYLDKMIQT